MKPDQRPETVPQMPNQEALQKRIEQFYVGLRNKLGPENTSGAYVCEAIVSEGDSVVLRNEDMIPLDPDNEDTEHVSWETMKLQLEYLAKAYSEGNINEAVDLDQSDYRTTLPRALISRLEEILLRK